MLSFVETRTDSLTGFDSITRQIERKLLKRGFQFNVILVGTRYNRDPPAMNEADTSQDKPVWASRPWSTPSLPRT